MTEVSLRKPKRTRGTTQETMDAVMQHLYRMRVATIRQLLQLINHDLGWPLSRKIKEAAFRRQLERYPYVATRKMSVKEYLGTPKEWVDVSNVAMYHLDRETTVQLEATLGENYYTSNSDRNPVPERSTVNHHVLMSELYTRMYCHEMRTTVGFKWLPSVGFNVELAKLRDAEAVDTSMRVPVLCGALVEDSGLWGFGVYDGETINGFKRSLSMYIPQRSLFENYNLLMFVTRDRSGDAQRRLVDIADIITIRNPELPVPRREPPTAEEIWKRKEEKENKELDARKYTHVLPYEWAVRNPDVVKHVLRVDHESIMGRFLQPSLCRFKAYLSKSESNYFGWTLTDSSGESMLIDTTIGKTSAQIARMLRSRERGYKRMLVPTEEEKQTWEKFAEKFLVAIDFQVVDPSEDDIRYEHEYADLDDLFWDTDEEFDEALDKYLLSGIS